MAAPGVKGERPGVLSAVLDKPKHHLIPLTCRGPIKRRNTPQPSEAGDLGPACVSGQPCSPISPPPCPTGRLGSSHGGGTRFLCPFPTQSGQAPDLTSCGSGPCLRLATSNSRIQRPQPAHSSPNKTSAAQMLFPSLTVRRRSQQVALACHGSAVGLTQLLSPSQERSVVPRHSQTRAQGAGCGILPCSAGARQAEGLAGTSATDLRSLSSRDEANSPVAEMPNPAIISPNTNPVGSWLVCTRHTALYWMTSELLDCASQACTAYSSWRLAEL